MKTEWELMCARMYIEWAYAWGLWSYSDDWRVGFTEIQPFTEFAGVLGC